MGKEENEMSRSRARPRPYDDVREDELLLKVNEHRIRIMLRILSGQNEELGPYDLREMGLNPDLLWGTKQMLQDYSKWASTELVCILTTLVRHTQGLIKQKQANENNNRNNPA